MAVTIRLSSDRYDEEPGNGQGSTAHVGMSVYYSIPRLSATGGMGCTVPLRMPMVWNTSNTGGSVKT